VTLRAPVTRQMSSSPGTALTTTLYGAQFAGLGPRLSAWFLSLGLITGTRMTRMRALCSCD
jgi:hypothetical protein